jgi:hypothetical protein
MKKKVLTEQALYYGEVKIPKGYEVDPLEMCQNILRSFYLNNDASYCKSWGQLNTYIRENFQLRHNLQLINKDTWGDIFYPNEKFNSLSNVDPIDLKNSPDFTCLYGINTEDCKIEIFYDDNRRAGRSWEIELKPSMYVIFPSTNAYTIYNNQRTRLNFIQTITYEYT